MKFISTRHGSPPVNFEEALLRGLAPDGGLYIPTDYPPVSFENHDIFSLGDRIMEAFLPEIPQSDLQKMIRHTLNFPIPLIALDENIFLLEVFHGPTLAFKDVGARFMASALSYFLKKEQKKVTILVATSGDTGSAIAHGFHNMPNIDVYILYPSQKITFLQEQQMTTLGGNIHALEVDGTFDDCQKLVKTALMDDRLRQQHLLTTANSINIARLLPQIIYHSWGVVQLRQQGIHVPPILSVPSGNFGNLTAAIYAKRLGLPVHHFLAATNINATVPHYLDTGEFLPQPSQRSHSNAMDVGNPSNFERLLALYPAGYHDMQKDITGIAISDDETLQTIRKVYEHTGYIVDPHTAVGVAAAKKRQHKHPLIVTSTAHPAKFPEVIEAALGIDVPMPPVLQRALEQTKYVIRIPAQYNALVDILQCARRANI